MSSRFPSPPRDIFGGGYGSGGTVLYFVPQLKLDLLLILRCLQVGGSPNGAFVFDGDCDFQVTDDEPVGICDV
jgi:hypothetical protein